ADYFDVSLNYPVGHSDDPERRRLCYNLRKGVIKMAVAQTTVKENLSRRILDMSDDMPRGSSCLSATSKGMNRTRRSQRY
ncbi:MAG: hypothetical protein LBQ42_13415, partial [Synergistaceae bacterium]|nr:hypothetical protein [Synergistaceae bacterium]